MLINDILFKSRRSIDWDEIEQILRKYIGVCFEITETAEKVYIGTDFPDEFTHSKYTKAIKGANEKAKANAISAIGELLQIADNKSEFPDYDGRHGNKAKNGWYRYDTRFGIPVYSESGEIERYNIFRARMLLILLSIRIFENICAYRGYRNGHTLIGGSINEIKTI